MGFGNSEAARDRLNSGFWDRFKQATMDYDDVVACVPENFSLNDEDIAKCDHCGDEFEVDKGMSKLVSHLQNNHAGYIVEVTE